MYLCCLIIYVPLIKKLPVCLLLPILPFFPFDDGRRRHIHGIIMGGGTQLAATAFGLQHQHSNKEEKTKYRHYSAKRERERERKRKKERERERETILNMIVTHSVWRRLVAAAAAADKLRDKLNYSRVAKILPSQIAMTL
jgi:hypothetical protein